MIKAIMYTFENRFKYCHINVYIALMIQYKMLKLQKQHKFVHFYFIIHIQSKTTYIISL
ncbi:hypothetical protein SXY01_21100 [Staphylococcus xylosus]|nr:hypothetical protein SXY01_21100 [Staphylococcus xylosus]